MEPNRWEAPGAIFDAQSVWLSIGKQTDAGGACISDSCQHVHNVIGWRLTPGTFKFQGGELSVIVEAAARAWSYPGGRHEKEVRRSARRLEPRFMFYHDI